MKLSNVKRVKHSNINIRVRVSKDYPWKILDKLVHDLDDCLLPSDKDLIVPIIRNRDYSAYLSLAETWGPQSNPSPSDISANLFGARYQILSLLKKFQFPSDSKSRKAAALEKFIAAECVCSTFNHIGFKTLRALNVEDELCVFTHMGHFLRKLLGDDIPDRGKLTEWSRHGPGSNLDTKERRTSLYDKYRNWPYSCTSGARDLAQLSIQDDERWLGALEDSYRRKNGIHPSLILDQKVFWENVLNVVPGNRISFVPKNSQTDRSIAIEPCMNLYLQLGVDGFIRRRLKRWGVDLDSQEKNQVLAEEGSRNWESRDPFVTLDLAAASDTVSVELCRLLLPPQWFSYLMSIRSPEGVCGDEVISYEKISSMGNGFTFALESAIFASIVYGVQKVLKGCYDEAECAVYGDDIIVRASHADLVIRMLNRSGFSINPEKSFVKGPFRESCGSDWYSGTSVRPVFLTTSPSTVKDLFCDSNRLRRFLSLRSWGFTFEVCNFIEQSIPSHLMLWGPISDEDFDSYIHTPKPTVRYKRGVWKFKRLGYFSRDLKGDSFFFRKLMHTLRDAEPSPCKWLKVTGAGSRFAIVSVNSTIASYSYSPVSYWQDEYTAPGSFG